MKRLPVTETLPLRTVPGHRHTQRLQKPDMNTQRKSSGSLEVAKQGVFSKPSLWDVVSSEEDQIT